MALNFVKQASVRNITEDTKAKIAASRAAGQIDLKYTVRGKEEDERVEKFIVSKGVFTKLGLDDKGFVAVYDDGKDADGNETSPKVNYLAVIAEENAVFMKGNKGSVKGRNFSSTNLRDNLVDAGAIDKDAAKGTTVKFNLVESTLDKIGLAEGNEEGFTAVYVIEKAADQSGDDNDEGEEEVKETKTSKSKASKSVTPDEEYA